MPPLEVGDFPQVDLMEFKAMNGELFKDIHSVVSASQELINNSMYQEMFPEFIDEFDDQFPSLHDGFGEYSKFIEISELEEEFREVDNLKR
ncbi:hypothetical protein J5N97_016518 [Dioscorea zingiberensis]|uniref:Uncharacterized protein n=1 Tax=Dioscorea zingiberensis TaxID=325984 RepID=A0A9D5HFQ4_9LILI|nr:hypothetical protein J5N97_016518 [Dioscorea zingiberensis]